MNIKERKRLIGLLIGVYREELFSFDSEKFNKSNFCMNVCCVNTLKKLEQGYICRNSIYPEILQKFNLKFGFFKKVDDAVELSLTSLYEAIEFYDIDAIMTISYKILRLLNRLKNYVYYSEIHELITDVKNHYLKNEFITEHKAKHYEKMLEIFPSVYSDLYKILIIERAALYATENCEAYTNSIKKYNLIKSDKPYMKLLIVKYFSITNKFDCMNEVLSDLEQTFLHAKNYIRLVDVYNYYIILYTYINKSKRLDYIEKMEGILENALVSDYKIGETYSTLANIYHYEKEYQISLRYFKLMVKHQKTFNLIDLLYMANCQSRLELNINIPPVENIEKYPVFAQHMYFFYANYKALSLIEKQDLIMEKILPFNKDKDLAIVFQFELRKLINETNCYKKLYIYDKVLEEMI